MSVAVGTMQMRGPVLAASGTFGYGTEVPLLERRALGGMVSKGIFLRPREGTTPPRIAETPSGMLNAIGLQGPGADALVRDYAPQWAGWDFPVLVNINGESASEYGELTARLDGVPGIAGFEINISCPNVEQGGLYFGNDPRAAAAVTEAVRRRTKLPLWVKLTPMVSDIGVIARAVESAGADALCAINTFVGMSIDLNAFKPRLNFRTGGLSGPAIRPLAVHLAHQASRRFSKVAGSSPWPTCRATFHAIREGSMSTEIPPRPIESGALQILATEHWSLLATRALTYQESLGRVNMFLTILSGAVIALALVAQADHFGPAFFAIAIFMLAVVFLVGVFTVARLMALNRDDFRWVLGMNRLRNAYLDLHPELEPHFTTSPYDDLPGALQTLGVETSGADRLGSMFHGLQTLPGMLSLIVAAVAGAIGGLVAVGFGAPPVAVLLSGL